MVRRARRVPGALAVLLAATLALAGLPDAGPMADAGRAIARSTAASHRGIGALGVLDAAAPAAAAVLLWSLLIIGVVGSALLAGPAPPPVAGSGDATVRIPAAALVGLASGFGAVIAGAGGAVAFGVAASAAAAGLLLAGLGDGPPAEVRRPVPPRRAARAAGLVVLGALLFVASGGADGLLQSLAEVRPIPEAWFVVAAEAGAGWLRPAVLGPIAAVAALAAATERTRDRCGGPDGGADLAVAAAGWALLVGPSSPCRALALAWSLRCLERIGVPYPARAAFVVALTAGMAGMVHL